MHTLFETDKVINEFKHLAQKMRPMDLDEFVGQEQIMGENSVIKSI